ncbi:MAG: S-methyl-5-thioribose-1-phosphate isomerase, partial [Ignavibacteriaceae bacterium]
MKRNSYFSIKYENESVIYLDQTRLPLEEMYIETDDYERIASAIERLEIRGAPLIGIAAAYALALSIKGENQNTEERFQTAYQRLKRTRPTAVNLFAALSVMREEFINREDSDDSYNLLLNK